jgi:hypothetical protein
MWDDDCECWIEKDVEGNSHENSTPTYCDI